MSRERRATLQEVRTVVEALHRDHPEALKALRESFARADRERQRVDFAGVDIPMIFRLIERLNADVEEHDTSGRDAIFSQTIDDLKYAFYRNGWDTFVRDGRYPDPLPTRTTNSRRWRSLYDKLSDLSQLKGPFPLRYLWLALTHCASGRFRRRC